MFKFVKALLEYDELKEQNYRLTRENIELYRKVKNLVSEINDLKFEKNKTCKNCRHYEVENHISGDKQVTRIEKCTLGDMILGDTKPCELFKKSLNHDDLVKMMPILGLPRR